MPKFITIAWVKYVHNQRINSSIIGGLLSPFNYNPQPTNLIWWVKGRFIQPITQLSTTTLSTTQNTYNKLLNKSFTHNPQHLLMRLMKEN